MAAVLGNQVSHATTTALMNMKMKGRQYDGSEYQPKRKVGQKPIDPFCSLIAEAGERAYRDNHVIPVIPAHPYHSKDMLPGHSTRLNPIMAATPKWVHTIYFKPLKNAAGARIPQFFSSICFTPDGRRFVTANNLGEFTLWHGTSLASEMRTMGHEDAQVSSTVWCEQADFMISSDSKGAVKYWGRNMNNLKSIEAAQNPIRELSASPSASKFACGSTDGLIKLFDTDSARLERTLEGHGNEVRTCDWHPKKNLFASGGKDLRGGKVILWDPRAAESISSLLGHSDGVTKVRWNRQEDYWLLTSSADCSIKLFDLRKMQELYTFTGHKKEVMSVSWHPHHSGMFASGGKDGQLNFWVVGQSVAKTKDETRVCSPVSTVYKAHDQHSVREVLWHPLGHTMASSAFDCKFWTHNKPGAVEEVRGVEVSSSFSHFGQLAAQQGRRWNSYVPNAEAGTEEGSAVSIVSTQRPTPAKRPREDEGEEPNKDRAPMPPPSMPTPPAAKPDAAAAAPGGAAPPPSFPPPTGFPPVPAGAAPQLPPSGFSVPPEAEVALPPPPPPQQQQPPPPPPQAEQPPAEQEPEAEEGSVLMEF